MKKTTISILMSLGLFILGAEINKAQAQEWADQAQKEVPPLDKIESAERLLLEIIANNPTPRIMNIADNAEDPNCSELIDELILTLDSDLDIRDILFILECQRGITTSAQAKSTEK